MLCQPPGRTLPPASGSRRKRLCGGHGETVRAVGGPDTARSGGKISPAVEAATQGFYGSVRSRGERRSIPDSGDGAGQRRNYPPGRGQARLGCRRPGGIGRPGRERRGGCPRREAAEVACSPLSRPRGAGPGPSRLRLAGGGRGRGLRAPDRRRPPLQRSCARPRPRSVLHPQHLRHRRRGGPRRDLLVAGAGGDGGGGGVALVAAAPGAEAVEREAPAPRPRKRGRDPLPHHPPRSPLVGGALRGHVPGLSRLRPGPRHPGPGTADRDRGPLLRPIGHLAGGHLLLGGDPGGCPGQSGRPLPDRLLPLGVAVGDGACRARPRRRSRALRPPALVEAGPGSGPLRGGDQPQPGLGRRLQGVLPGAARHHHLLPDQAPRQQPLLLAGAGDQRGRQRRPLVPGPHLHQGVRQRGGKPAAPPPPQHQERPRARQPLGRRAQAGGLADERPCPRLGSGAGSGRLPGRRGPLRYPGSARGLRLGGEGPAGQVAGGHRRPCLDPACPCQGS